MTRSASSMLRFSVALKSDRHPTHSRSSPASTPCCDLWSPRRATVIRERCRVNPHDPDRCDPRLPEGRPPFSERVLIDPRTAKLRSSAASKGGRHSAGCSPRRSRQRCCEPRPPERRPPCGDVLRWRGRRDRCDPWSPRRATAIPRRAVGVVRGNAVAILGCLEGRPPLDDLHRQAPGVAVAILSRPEGRPPYDADSIWTVEGNTLRSSATPKDERHLASRPSSDI